MITAKEEAKIRKVLEISAKESVLNAVRGLKRSFKIARRKANPPRHGGAWTVAKLAKKTGMGLTAVYSDIRNGLLTPNRMITGRKGTAALAFSDKEAKEYIAYRTANKVPKNRTQDIIEYVELYGKEQAALKFGIQIKSVERAIIRNRKGKDD